LDSVRRRAKAGVSEAVQRNRWAVVLPVSRELNELAQLGCFFGVMGALTIVVCELGVLLGWIKKEDEE
jgi:hypothetical protein